MQNTVLLWRLTVKNICIVMISSIFMYGLCATNDISKERSYSKNPMFTVLHFSSGGNKLFMLETIVFLMEQAQKRGWIPPVARAGCDYSVSEFEKQLNDCKLDIVNGEELFFYYSVEEDENGFYAVDVRTNKRCALEYGSIDDV
jgi:hypothetical protein